MKYAREQIAEKVFDAMSWAAMAGPTPSGCAPEWQGGNSFGEDEARKTAASIISAMPEIVGAMVKPLVWSGFSSGPYEIEVDNEGIANLYNYGDRDEDRVPEYMLGGFLTLVSIDDLKQAANDHHRAQVLGALGL